MASTKQKTTQETLYKSRSKDFTNLSAMIKKESIKTKGKTKMTMEKKSNYILTKIYHVLEVEKNNRFPLRKILVNLRMSDSHRKALFDCGIIRKEGLKSNATYYWTAGELTNKIYENYIKKVREINKFNYARNKPNLIAEHKADEVENPIKIKKNYGLRLLAALVASTIIYKLVKKCSS